MELSDLTAQIIKKREKKREVFGEKDSNLRLWSSRLNSLIELDSNAYWPEVIKCHEQEDKWSKILDAAQKLNRQIALFTSPKGDFTLAYNRAQRMWVNIGAVGIMREGKSEFIALATQLDKWVLPRKGTEHACTTAAINIINGKSPDGCEEVVRVFYHTVEEMVNIFRDFLVALGDDPEIISFEKIKTRAKFKEWCNSHIDMTFANKIAQGKTQLQLTFKEYRENVSEYIDRLIENKDDKEYDDYPIEDVKKGGVIGEKYYSSVSYYRSPSSKDGSEVFTSFATREAKVYTNFNVAGDTNVTNIQFLDTPGVGEQKVGIEKLLKDAVIRDLDIVIGIRKVGDGAANPLGEALLFNVLRESMATWPRANEWIYFILNAFPGTTYNQSQVSQKRIIDNLAIAGVDKSKIELEGDHFSTIDLLKNIEITENRFNDDNPLGHLLTHILTDFIPKIKDIDNDFYRIAEKEYNNIQQAYLSLVEDVKALRLPTFNNVSKTIDNHLEALHSALTKQTASINDITAGMHDQIISFCGKGEKPDFVGLEVAKVFGIEEKPFTSKEDLLQNLTTVADAEFRFAWNNRHEFQTYQLKRDALINTIKKSLFAKIDWSEASEALKNVKENVCRVYMQDGLLAKIVSEKDLEPFEWLDLFITQLDEEGEYPDLVNLFTQLKEYRIDAEQEMNQDVEDAAQKGFHFDDFGNWGFKKPENALRSFLESLLHIESATKNRIEEDMAANKVSKIETEISNVFHPVINSVILAQSGIAGKKPSRQQFEDFFRVHSKVFVNDTDTIKQGLVETCKRFCK